MVLQNNLFSRLFVLLILMIVHWLLQQFSITVDWFAACYCWSIVFMIGTIINILRQSKGWLLMVVVERNVLRRWRSVRLDRTTMLIVAWIRPWWRWLICRLTRIHRADGLVLQSRRVWQMWWALWDVIGIIVIKLSVCDLRHPIRLMDYVWRYLKRLNLAAFCFYTFSYIYTYLCNISSIRRWTCHFSLHVNRSYSIRTKTSTGCCRWHRFRTSFWCCWKRSGSSTGRLPILQQSIQSRLFSSFFSLTFWIVVRTLYLFIRRKN